MVAAAARMARMTTTLRLLDATANFFPVSDGRWVPIRAWREEVVGAELVNTVRGLGAR